MAPAGALQRGGEEGRGKLEGKGQSQPLWLRDEEQAGRWGTVRDAQPLSVTSQPWGHSSGSACTHTALCHTSNVLKQEM